MRQHHNRGIHAFPALLTGVVGFCIACSGALFAAEQPDTEKLQRERLQLLKGRVTGQIAFQAKENGKWRVFVVDFGETEAQPIAVNEAADQTRPQWTYDNKRLALLSSTDGRGRVILCDMEASPNSESPRYSPITGEDLNVKAFHITRDARMMTVKTGPRDWHLMTLKPSAYDRRGEISPGPSSWEARRVTLGEFDEEGLAIDLIPSPNARKVALVVTLSDHRRARGAPASGVYLAKIGSDGKLGETKRTGPGLSAAWSSDSLRLMMCRYAPGGCDIYQYDSSTGECEHVTHEKGWEWNPAWSPDREWIVYASAVPPDSEIATGEYDCFLRELPDGDPIRLTFDDGPEVRPAWRGIVAGSRAPGQP